MDLSLPSSSAAGAGAKRLKLSTPAPKAAQPQSKWRSPAQETLYRRRLLDALRSQASPDPRAIKNAADSALALSARGHTRWSRAILSRRWKLKKTALRAAGKVRRKRPPPPAAAEESKSEGKVGQRLRRLARLVPGCRKAPTGSLLEETADYVAALEVQIRAMRALADALSAAAISPRGQQEEDAGS